MDGWIIGSWTWDSIILHILGSSCNDKWPWVFSNKILVCIVARSWKFSCLLRNHISSIGVSHLVNWSAILHYTHVRIVVPWPWNLTSLNFLRSASNADALSILTKPLRWIIFTRSRLIEHLLSHNLSSLTLRNLMRYNSISDKVRISLVCSWAWHIWLDGIIWFASDLERLCILAEFINWGILTRPRKFLNLLLHQLRSQSLWNCIRWSLILHYRAIRIVLSRPRLLLLTSLASSTHRVLWTWVTELVRASVLAWTWLTKRLSRC